MLDQRIRVSPISIVVEVDVSPRNDYRLLDIKIGGKTNLVCLERMWDASEELLVLLDTEMEVTLKHMQHMLRSSGQ